MKTTSLHLVHLITYKITIKYKHHSLSYKGTLLNGLIYHQWDGTCHCQSVWSFCLPDVSILLTVRYKCFMSSCYTNVHLINYLLSSFTHSKCREGPKILKQGHVILTPFWIHIQISSKMLLIVLCPKNFRDIHLKPFELILFNA